MNYAKWPLARVVLGSVMIAALCGCESAASGPENRIALTAQPECDAEMIDDITLCVSCPDSAGGSIMECSQATCEFRDDHGQSCRTCSDDAGNRVIDCHGGCVAEIEADGDGHKLCTFCTDDDGTRSTRCEPIACGEIIDEHGRSCTRCANESAELIDCAGPDPGHNSPGPPAQADQDLE